MRRLYEEERLAAAPPQSRPPPDPQVEDQGVLDLASAIGNRAFADLVAPSDAKAAGAVTGGENELVDSRGGSLARQELGGPLAPPGPVGPVLGGASAVTATVMGKIRHATTPALMAVDRIPPRVGVAVPITLAGWAIPTAPATFRCLFEISPAPIGLPLDASGPRPHSPSLPVSRDRGSPHCTRNPGTARWTRRPS